MPAPDRHEFHVESDPDVDVLMRILGLFAVQDAVPASLRHEQAGDGAWTVLEVAGLTPERAELVRLRLLQTPCVRDARLASPLALVAAAK